MKNYSIPFCLLGLLIAFDAQAASLMNDQIYLNSQGYGSDVFITSRWATVSDPGVEFSGTLSYYTHTADFQEDTFTLSTTIGVISSSGTHEWRFENLNFDDNSTITEVVLVSSTPAQRICWDEDRGHNVICYDADLYDQATVTWGDDWITIQHEGWSSAQQTSTGTYRIITTSAAPPDGTPCDDNSACTFNDYYLDGICTGTSLTCSDGNDCTADICYPDSGCTNDFMVLNTSSCDDGDPTTSNDTCFNGVCGGDADSDGVEDSVDNCPQNANADQLDYDGDQVGDICDLKGDLDGDNRISLTDMSLLLSHNGQNALDCPPCDINSDGIINTLDARLLTQENPSMARDPNLRRRIRKLPGKNRR